MITAGIAYLTGGVVVFIAFRVAEFPANDALRQAAVWPYHLGNLVEIGRAHV